MKYKGITLGVVVLVSILLGFATHQNTTAKNLESAMQIIDTSDALFPQKVAAKTETPVEVTKLFHEGQFVGMIHDVNRMNKRFDDVYETEYKEAFPNSKLGFTEDIYQTKSLSYSVYEDRDDEIFAYIKEKDLFAVETDKVVFSNGAVIYVKDIDAFNSARERFVKNFVSEASYDAIKNRRETVVEADGMRDISLSVKESIKFEKALVSKNNILTSEEAILTFLNYGYEPKIETYAVKKFDTVEGVGAQNGMSATQIVSINSDKLKSKDQLLEVGTTLNVSKFNSPFTVEVVKERRETEPVYPEDIEYVEDPELAKGDEVVETVEQNGAADVVYNITYINGKEVASKELNRKETKAPVRGVTRVGTKEAEVPKPTPGTGGISSGNGSYRWPLDSGSMICAYGCYGGHTGVDLQPFGVYGSIYSIARGVVDGKGYDATGWGYWVRINHGNGYRSLYAHMPGPSVVGQGQTVSSGQYLGQVGQTGYATTPHLHLEIWDASGSRLNACNFIACR